MMLDRLARLVSIKPSSMERQKIKVLLVKWLVLLKKENSPSNSLRSIMCRLW